MTDLRTAAKQAVEALERADKISGYANNKKVITALKAALAQQAEPVAPVAEAATTQQQLADTPPSDYRRSYLDGYFDGFAIGKREGRIEAEDAAKQAEPVEPVAYRHLHEDGWEYHDAPTGEDCAECQALYTAPPQRKPLTEEEIDALPWNGSPRQFARTVERALEEKNRGR